MTVSYCPDCGSAVAADDNFCSECGADLNPDPPARSGADHRRADIPEYEQKRKENLDRIYDLREELQIVADADIEYAKYAQNALDTLREEGYDV